VMSVVRERVPALPEVAVFQAIHSRTFRFACRFFALPRARRIARVYAFCRVTDDLVDRPPEGVDPEACLGLWIELSREAYEGRATGIPLLDCVMREMADAAAPFRYVEELAEGMRMDFRGERYQDLGHLHRYTYRVASVVGLWVARLEGCHQPSILHAAERMGRAMPPPNILRAVGEDLRRGRLYLPGDLLRRYRVAENELLAACDGARLPAGYPALIEDLIAVAEADYEVGLRALTHLSPGFARPVAVA